MTHRSWPARVGTCLAVAASLAGCSTSTAIAPHQGTLVTINEATAVVRHFQDVVNQASAHRDKALIDTVETGYAAAADEVYFAAEARTTTPPSPPRTVKKLLVYVPYQSSYPAQFMAFTVTSSALSDPVAALLVFVRTSAADPWKLESSADYIANTPPPPIALDDAGYATLLSKDQASRLAVTPDHLGATYATTLGQHLGAGSLTSLAPFAPGPFTSGKIRDDHQSVTPSPGDYRRLGIAYGALPNHFVTAYQEVGGGALVTFVSTETDTYTAVSGKADLTQNSNRTYYSYVVPPGTYSSITVHSISTDVASIAAGVVAVLGGGSSASSADVK